jgi:long-chain acyl-CoA synthetase
VGGPDAAATAVDVAARLRATAAERPDRPALVWADGSWTYGQLHDRVELATSALQSLGVGPGDRVALVAGTTPTFVEVAAAVLRGGATLVPLLPGLAPDELRYVLDDARTTVAVVGPERAAEVAALLPELRHPPRLATAGTSVDGADRWEE